MLRIFYTLIYKLVFFVFLLMFLLKLSSCKKYLDKKSDDKLVVPTSLEDLQALLNNTQDINSVTPARLEAASDDYFVLDNTYNMVDEIFKMAYTWTPFDYVWPNDWSNNYNVVYTSNWCLENINKLERTTFNEAKWNNVKGSALFFRSYHFLLLAWTYAKAYDEQTAQTDRGIVLRLGSDFNIPSVRASVKETYDQIIADAKEAVPYLPDHPSHTSQPSKAAAYGLLARAYLSMRQYDSAGKYANLCLNIKNDLLDFSTEVDISASTPFSRFNKETIFYSKLAGSLFIYSSVYAKVDTLLYSFYNTNDLRRSAYFAASGNYYIYKGGYSAELRPFSGIATDEIYLIRAECYAREGDKDKALNDLNILLEKRYDNSFIPEIAATSQDALPIILKERRKELLFRGLRWVDIKRLNKEGANIIPKRIVAGQVYTLQPNESKYALPLPTDIINLSGIEQN